MGGEGGGTQASFTSSLPAVCSQLVPKPALTSTCPLPGVGEPCNGEWRMGAYEDGPTFMLTLLIQPVTCGQAGFLPGPQMQYSDLQLLEHSSFSVFN